MKSLKNLDKILMSKVKKREEPQIYYSKTKMILMKTIIASMKVRAKVLFRLL